MRSLLSAVIFVSVFFIQNLPASPKGRLPSSLKEGPVLRVGEELHYDIRWGIIPAGSGTLEISRGNRENGLYHIVTTARSNAFIDTFYKVRNRIETDLDLPRRSSDGYQKIQREGRHHRNVSLVFDHTHRKVTLIRNGKVKKILRVPSSIHDPLSAIYYLRTLKDLEGGPTILNVTDGKKTYRVLIKVLGKERVKTPLGFFNAIKIEPVVEDLELIFDKKKGGRLLIWLTDDQEKVPIKLKSELAFGSIQALLTGVKTGSVSSESWATLTKRSQSGIFR